MKNYIGIASGSIREIAPNFRRVWRNREGVRAYNFQLPARDRRPGVSAMLRVKNEEDKIWDCLSSIYGLFTEIVCIDNDSDDSTLKIIERFKSSFDATGKINITSYPYRIARCGTEHFMTPENSVHSLAYYYNWCLAQCSCYHVCKWDADMILDRRGAPHFRDLLAKVQAGGFMKVEIPVQTVYRDPDQGYFLSIDEVHQECRIFPNLSSSYFVKATDWERLRTSRRVKNFRFGSLCVYEVKDIGSDEFEHWTPGTSFETGRKKQEIVNYMAIGSGIVDPSRFIHLGNDFARSAFPIHCGDRSASEYRVVEPLSSSNSRSPIGG